MAYEAAGGVVLMAAAALAIAAANSPLQGTYEALLQIRAEVRIGELALAKPLILWINDGLMAVFFFLVGLEIKRAVLEGDLSTPSSAALPLIAALGGIVVPAGVYVALNAGDPATLRGWAIPAATDIAFALGVLLLLGKRVPTSLKLLLSAVAVLDDLAAIVIIAAFYTESLSFAMLGLSLACVGLLALFNRLGVMRVTPYAIVGVVLWVCVLKSGVHATLAGVATALAIPMRDSAGHSPLVQLEHGLSPWVAFGVVPVFAFANAGVSLGGLEEGALTTPLALGIIAGLVAGKAVGVFLFGSLGVALGLARLPARASLVHFAGVAFLCGIGFTMSLFIGNLAFPDEPGRMAVVRLSVLAGSLVSALVGVAVLLMANRSTAFSGQPGGAA
jgi:NhaA family Na+:H+ antiporter